MDRLIPKKKFKPKRDIPVGIGVLFLLILILTTAFDDHSSRLNVKTERITISTVQHQPFQEFIPISGTVMPIQTVYIDALEGGRVESIHQQIGNMVQPEDTILCLENTNLRLQVMQQQASILDERNRLRNSRVQMVKQQLTLQDQLADYDNRIKKARRSYLQNQDLLKNKIISRQVYEDSKDDYEYQVVKRKLAIESAQQDSILMALQIEQLSSSLGRLQNNFEILQERLDHLVVRAPLEGQLTSLNAEYTGEIKSQGARLGQIDVLSGFRIRAGIDEHYLPRIHPDLAAEFDFAGQTCRLNINRIFPEIVQGQFNVDLAFENEDPKQLRRGQTVHIRLELGDLSDAVTVARGGFYQKTGGQWIFVLNETGDLAEKRAIKLGRQNTEVFEVISGLKQGERVITSSYDNFGNAEKLVLK